MMNNNFSAELYDLMVIGGGINGCGIAADAASRGLKVLLCEQQDLAAATSSNSSKLIHGGLRYLEHYEFRLVREALAEREVLLKVAPHIIWPLRFRLPHQPHLRPALLIRLGLFLYDHLARRVTLPASKGFRFGEVDPLVNTIHRGFEYSDAWVDDSRLVVLNALAAQAHGATILTRTCFQAVSRQGSLWHAELFDKTCEQIRHIKARSIVNAAGPWVANLFEHALPGPSPQKIRLVKGSHIVVPKLHNDPQAYILQNEDQRIVFVIPYEDDFSLIGTTDVDYQGDPAHVAISDAEIDYLLQISNSYFRQKISRQDICHSYSGVRPLLDDEADSAQAVTRDYKLEWDAPTDAAPLLSVFGGKITTYRKLAQAAVDRIASVFPDLPPCTTAQRPLPGGDFLHQAQLLQQLSNTHKFVPAAVLSRYVRSYGTLSYTLLAGCTHYADLGEDFGHGLYQAEVSYLLNHEWAQSAEDILWRRTKLGLRLDQRQQKRLQEFVATKLQASHVA
jgi:glycerol-3-phosphate dehydrogenase